MNDFLLYLGIPLGAIILTYIFARWINGNAILTSKPVDTTAGVNADQYYYLPSYVLTLRATARIAVHKTTDDLITDAQLSAMTFDFETKIEPDTSQLIVLNYKGDWFSNDELKIETTGESLLQNISVKTEDRFPQIVSIFTNAPKELIKSLHESGQQTAQPTPLAVKIEFVETTKTFVITPDEITTGNIKKEWSIQLNGDFTGTPTPVDAGFTLKSPKRAPAIAGNTYKGILSRPMTRQKWDVEVNNQVEPYSFSCTVPDIASVLVTPVRRSLFTKRQQIPRFSNGVLTENFIDKSSEWEAFASIPVNIGKALVSIPAQLLQFKIIRIKQDTEYEKAVGALIKAKEENAKLALEKVNTELKAALDALAKAKAQTQQTQPDQQVPDVPPLGKLAPKGKVPTKRITDAIKEKAEGLIPEANIQGEELPVEKFWDQKFQGDWKDFGNKVGGANNCVPAAAAHMIMCWTSNTKPSITILESSDIDRVFTTKCSVSGCDTADFLDVWRKLGIGTNTIISSAPIVRKTRKDMKEAIWRFGACMVGFNLPIIAQTQKDNWKLVPGANPQLTAEGSWGRHGVAAVGYDADKMVVISWGRKISVDWDFYETYNDESYVVLSNDWKQDGQNSPSGFSFEALRNIVRNLNS